MDASGKELTARDLWQLLDREYRLGSIAAPKHRVLAETDDAGVRTVTMAARIDGPTGSVAIDGAGTGPIDAFVNGFNAVTGQSIRVLDYHEHAVGAGANAQAVAYLELRIDERQTLFGVGMDGDILTASLKAILSGIARARAVQTGQDRFEKAGG